MWENSLFQRALQLFIVRFRVIQKAALLSPEFLGFRYLLNIISLGSCFQSTKMRNFGVQTV